jgi:arylsulfatase A-like enzyme
MKSVCLISCLLLGLVAFQSSASAQRALPRRPNIILIVADGLGAGDLSCYGQTMFQTPNLDKLATDGIRFTNYLAGGVTSSSARAALMLGKNISYAPDVEYSLTPNDITVAQVLKNSGYFTCLIGEWGLGDSRSTGAPWLKGFNEFAGFLDPAEAANVYADSFWRYEPDPLHEDEVMYNGREPIYDNTDGHKVNYVPDWFTTLANQFVKNHQPDRFNNYQPFFLLLSSPIPGNGYRTVPTDAPFTEEAWPQAEKNRAAAISRLDDDVGRLLEQLRKLGQASNTVIFFTSDTVPQKGGGVDPQFFHEMSSTNDVRVPMIVHWPGTIPVGQVSDQECSARDFLPTATSIALTRPPEKIEGASFYSALFNQK